MGDLEQFCDNLQKGDLIGPSVVETNLDNLNGHLDKWKAFVEDKEASFPKELRELEAILKKSREDWGKKHPRRTSIDVQMSKKTKVILVYLK